MPELSFASPAVTDADLNGAPINGSIIATFYLDAVKDEDASAEAGRPIFQEREHVEIRQSGNTREIRRREVRPADKQRWPREYAAFKQGLEAPVIGTPLSTLPFFTRSQCKEFEALGIKTAEQIRDMSDDNGTKFMGFQQMRRKVADFLLAAAGGAPLSAAHAEIAKANAEIAALKAQMAEVIGRTAEAAESKAGKGKA